MGAGGEPFCTAGWRDDALAVRAECPKTLLARARVSGLGRYRLPGLSRQQLRSSPPPRKWSKGSGQWPFKRQPRPLAPRPPPPCAGRALLGVGAGTRPQERRGGRAGPADARGGGMIHRLLYGCGGEGPAFPAGVHDLTSTSWSEQNLQSFSLLRKPRPRGWIPVGNSRGGGC